MCLASFLSFFNKVTRRAGRTDRAELLDSEDEDMQSRSICFLAACVLSTVLAAWGQSAGQQDSPKNGVSSSSDAQYMTKVPKGVILVKGAWSSASDSITPLPEDASVTKNVFDDRYFGISWALPPDWTEKYKGPPPSDSGRYVLAEIVTADSFKGPARGSILIIADDLFFTPLPVANSLELINYTKENLQADYKVERSPTQISIGGRPFTYFAYWSPAAELHWYILATQIRCHTVEVVLSSSDTKLLDGLMQELKKMKLPAEESLTGGDAVPVCIKDYAHDDNLIARDDPVFTERRFNPVPVRIIIDREGRIKHIHFLSAFPEQAKAISDALLQWKFRPYLRNGEPVEVETGIMFGYASHPAISSANGPIPK